MPKLSELPRRIFRYVPDSAQDRPNTAPELKKPWVTRKRRLEGAADVFRTLGLFCETCFPLSRDLWAFYNQAEDIKPDQELVVDWDFHLATLVDTARAGCLFCQFMAVRFFDDKHFTSEISSAPVPNPIACCYMADPTKPSPRVDQALANIGEFLSSHPNTSFTFIVRLSRCSDDGMRAEKIKLKCHMGNISEEIANKLLGYRKWIVLELYTSQDNFAAAFIGCHPVQIDAASDESITQAKTWIDTCHSTHTACPSLSSAILPSRVLEILDENSVRLSDGNFQAHYAILSYSWGEQQPNITTQSNLAQHKAGLRISNLAQTFQDAILVARKLELKYLWVDAICIIQDSSEDKAKELPKMSEYYKNAYVTISAARAGGSQMGFLHVRDACKIHSETGIPQDLLSMPYLCPDGEISRLFFREEYPYMSAFEPISRRAWTLQERILSPRVLVYGSHRFMWQCNTAQHSFGGVEDWSWDTAGIGNRRLSSQLTNKTESPLNLWYKAVEEYSRRELTLPSDKLPAIAGLATEIHTLLKDDYVVGHWRTSLLREILWSTYPHPQPQRADVWRAPSWSWISSTLNVSFSRLPPESALQVGKVISCDVTLQSPHFPFGEVLVATLQVEAPIFEANGDQIKVMLERTNWLPNIDDDPDAFHCQTTNLAFCGEKTLLGGDLSKEWSMPKRVSILVLFVEKLKRVESKADGEAAVDSAMQGENEQWYKSYGLVLTEVSDDHGVCYERLGALYSMFLTEEMHELVMTQRRIVRLV